MAEDANVTRLQDFRAFLDRHESETLAVVSANDYGFPDEVVPLPPCLHRLIVAALDILDANDEPAIISQPGRRLPTKED